MELIATCTDIMKDVEGVKTFFSKQKITSSLNQATKTDTIVKVYGAADGLTMPHGGYVSGAIR